MNRLYIPDDCWHIICGFLDVEDKVSLANTCTQLRSVIEENLSFCKSISVNQKLWAHLCKYERHVEDFFNCVSKKVRQLELNGMNSTQFEIARKLQFPNINSLNIEHINARSINDRPDGALLDIIRNISSTLEEITLDHCLWHHLNLLRNCEFRKVTSVTVFCKFAEDDDYEDVTRIFPGITKFSIMAPVPNQTLWKLQNLSELELTLDENTFDIIPSFETDPSLVRLRLRKLSIFKNRVSCDERRCTDFSDFLNLFEQIGELQIYCHATRSLCLCGLKRRRVQKVIFAYENLFWCDCGHDWLWTDIIARDKFRSQISGIAINSFLLKKSPDLRAFLAALAPSLTRFTVFDQYDKDNDKILQTRAYVEKQHLGNVPKINSIEDVRAALLEMIANSELLESFDVSANVCNLEFLENAVDAARSKCDSCGKSFTIRLYNTNIGTGDIKNISKPPGMEIILEHKEFELPAINSVVIELAQNLPEQFND